MGVASAAHSNLRLERWKRPFDLFLATGAALVLLPALVLTAFLIRVDSPGPVFFRQERIGRGGARFQIWKFRSMLLNCDDGLHREAAAAWFAGRPTNGRYKSTDDPRITRVGRFIRRTNLDEMPQLINVILGEMSLVGPRPGIPYELEHYLPWYFERQAVRPGITGLWQISRRETIGADDMMALDVRYVRECTPWLDLKILFWTIPTLLGRATRAR